MPYNQWVIDVDHSTDEQWVLCPTDGMKVITGLNLIVGPGTFGGQNVVEAWSQEEGKAKKWLADHKALIDQAKKEEKKDG